MTFEVHYRLDEERVGQADITFCSQMVVEAVNEADAHSQVLRYLLSSPFYLGMVATSEGKILPALWERLGSIVPGSIEITSAEPVIL